MDLNHDTVWAIAVATLGIGGYIYGFFTPSRYRHGCNECGAVQRRLKEQAEELAHDYEHRQGGKTDRFTCRDAACSRNPKDLTRL